jgi:hypothetical protein
VNIGNRRTPPSSRRARTERGTRPSRAARTLPKRSFVERNRGRILGAVAAVAVLGIAGIVYLSATSPAYACGVQWTPDPTPSPAPGATQLLGYVQQDTGREHVAPGSFVKYALCPPSTGNHYNQTGEGPIKPGLYGPEDQAIPQGWIHNLEHGALVLLYRCTSADTACTDSGQAALRQFTTSFPNSPICNIPAGSIGPVVARFDQMKWPYAAMVWGVVLPLDTFDTTQILTFFEQRGERTNPEQQCAPPTATPAPTDTAAPTDSPAPTDTAAPTDSPAATAAPTDSASPGAS